MRTLVSTGLRSTAFKGVFTGGFFPWGFLSGGFYPVTLDRYGTIKWRNRDLRVCFMFLISVGEVKNLWDVLLGWKVLARYRKGELIHLSLIILGAN